MTKRERVLSAVEGREPDRVPYSLWHHFRLDPPAGPGLAAATLEFARTYGPDLLKVMHDAPYDMPEGLSTISDVEDWRRLGELGGKDGNFGSQLETIKTILRERDDDLPVVATVFGVYAIAEKISGQRVAEHLQRDADAVEVGLDAITRSLRNYVSALTETGVDGIYLAMVGASADTLTAAVHRDRFLPREQAVLDVAGSLPLNVLHHHGCGIYPENAMAIEGYAIYSWSDRAPGNLGIREMRLRTQKCLMCGVNEIGFGEAEPFELLQQARDAVRAAGKTSFILAPGCALPTPPACTEDRLRVFAQAVGEVVNVNEERR